MNIRQGPTEKVNVNDGGFKKAVSDLAKSSNELHKSIHEYKISGKSKATYKKILKEPKRGTIVIRNQEPAEYKPIYFKQAYEEEKKLFFK